MEPYPFLFEPYLKEVLWGGRYLRPLKGLPANDSPIGESWEICGLMQRPSVVANGSLAGFNLRRLIDLFGADLLGRHVLETYAGEFPLLIKYIDAAQPLSVQVHPNDALARKLHGEGMCGKTEMWYVMDAQPEAVLYTGFVRQTNIDEYKARLTDGSLMALFAEQRVQVGDVFFLPAGRVHAIGAGCLIAEIQQSSDITYRIYDYDRHDQEGHLRALHTEEAAQAIDFTFDQRGYRTDYLPTLNGESQLVSCPYFCTSLIKCCSSIDIDLTDRDSFGVLQCVEGQGRIIVDGRYGLSLSMGDTVLIPAYCGQMVVLSDSCLSLLETHVP